MAILHDGRARSLEREKRCAELLRDLIPADQLLGKVQEELKTCLVEYREQMKSRWREGLYGMDQQFTANSNLRVEKAADSSGKKISITANCPKKSLVLYHGFETAGEPIPFKNTKFEIHEAVWKDSAWDKFIAVTASAPIDGVSQLPESERENYSATKGIRELGDAIKITSNGEIKNILNPSNPNQLDENGMAEIEGLDGTKEYIVVFEPNITEDDFNTLYASYDSVIKKFNGILTTFWNQPDPETLNKTQQQQYDEFYASVVDGTYDGSDVGENLSALMKGLLEGLYALWCGLRDIALWITNPQKIAADIAKLINNPEILEAQLKAATDSLDRILSIFKDEAFMFIIVKSILCYFKLLTPQQCHILLANGFGQALPQIVISIFLPAAKVDLLLEAAMTVGSTEKNKEEYRETKAYLDKLGTQVYGQ